jgi:hypothetical protein
MKRLIAALCLVAACSLVSCATVVPIAKDCSAVAVANLIDDVNTALSTGDYVGQLGKLVGNFGECAIVAAVREVAEKAGLRGQFDDLEAVKAQRARAWLDSRG